MKVEVNLFTFPQSCLYETLWILYRAAPPQWVLWISNTLLLSLPTLILQDEWWIETENFIRSLVSFQSALSSILHNSEFIYGISTSTHTKPELENSDSSKSNQFNCAQSFLSKWLRRLSPFETERRGIVCPQREFDLNLFLMLIIVEQLDESQRLNRWICILDVSFLI